MPPNNDGVIKLGNVHYQTEPHFGDLINDNSSFYLQILLTVDLQCNVFPFAQPLLNVCFCL